MSLPGRLRDAFPLAMRRTLRLGQRFAADLFQGTVRRAPQPANVADWHEVVSIRQPMTTTPNSAAKRHNIGLAARALSSRPIAPGALFSFWGWLGAPTAARGFQEGRALRGDQLVLESGGGLCQLSGALYAAALAGRLQIVERHAHSADLYTDETRFAPLGSDATVSYGFKDLRLRNPHTAAVAFLVAAEAESLTVRLVSQSECAAQSVEYRLVASGSTFVETETWASGRVIARNRYLRR